MSRSLCLTPHQHEAMEWLVVHVCDGAPLVALRGLAGTGKTSLIPVLREALAQQKITTVVGAPTHRAAMILRQKGVDDADTLHAQALTPFFTWEYTRALAWLGEHPPVRLERSQVQETHPDVDEVPWLIHEATKPDRAQAFQLRRQAGRLPARKLLASLGIHGKHHFAGFGPKQGQGVLLIDEASMVGETMLQLCQQAFHQIVLIGDPGQLPPVKDTAILSRIPGVELTEIHRQAADSPILQLAYRARHGEPFWQGTYQQVSPLLPHSDVYEMANAAAEAFFEAPLIVWRNVTRLTTTHAIRHALGFAKTQLKPGEPLVCRATSPEDRAEGFYNNGLYRILDVDAADPRRITVENALGEESTITAHLEEVDGETIPTDAIPFRFGYCLTAHTAQGGEWPTVYISVPDLLRYAGWCWKTDRKADIAQWAYTAMTRAKDTLCFLTQHTFERTTTMPSKKETTAMPETIAPPSAPMLLTTSPPGTSNAPLFGEDDIPDPQVPEEVRQHTAKDAPGAGGSPAPPPESPQASKTAAWAEHEALLHGAVQFLQGKLEPWLREQSHTHQASQEVIVTFMKDWAGKQIAANEHAQIQFSDALYKLQEHGLGLLGAPYQATVQAVSPQGYPVTLTIAKREEAALLADVGQLLSWLAEHGCGVPGAMQGA